LHRIFSRANRTQTAITNECKDRALQEEVGSGDALIVSLSHQPEMDGGHIEIQTYFFSYHSLEKTFCGG
jgi:hypothetical protein